MTPNIYLARALADERQREFLLQAERARSARRSRPPRPWPDWLIRLLDVRRTRPDPDVGPTVVRAPERLPEQRRPAEVEHHTDAAA
jgi:hypothetical protein